MRAESSLRSLSPSQVVDKLLEVYVAENHSGGTEPPHVLALRQQFDGLVRELRGNPEFVRAVQVQLMSVVGAPRGCVLKSRRAWEIYSCLGTCVSEVEP